MTKKKRLGHGIKVKVGTIFVGFAKSVKFADISREMINVTDLESVAEDFLDSDPPMIGQITCNASWDPDSSAVDGAIETLLLNDAIDERQVDMEFQYRSSSTGTAPTPSTWTYKYVRYTGRLVSISPAEVSSKTEMVYTITFQPTALPTRGTVA